uniref:tRNA/rRNA methyltransferase SpoU type domain-containing protein n=1 Tax=Chaetoceros debilis TaxID=122233 RepID=A0A7S3PXC9_9STRA|mmetsp:Transcript_11434/g.16661  ORF Transcript_11434/g.16661 Transcript_11434/m.16661 type:complete len:412 (+) Transcript_11434:232-1467(+)
MMSSLSIFRIILMKMLILNLVRHIAGFTCSAIKSSSRNSELGSTVPKQLKTHTITRASLQMLRFRDIYSHESSRPNLKLFSTDTHQGGEKADVENFEKSVGLESVELNETLSESERLYRTEALHQQLNIVGIDAESLAVAVNKSMTTLEGNDPYFGKSAIKAYKTFVYPRPSKIDAARNQDAEVAASRTARQIDFLAKRHRSHEAEWVRHTDTDVGMVELANANEQRKLFPMIVLLDNVRSAFNVGSIFRTADASGCSMVITTGITPSPNGSGREKLSKSALFADKVVETKHFITTKDAVDYIKEEHPGFSLIGMETTDLSRCYTSITYPGRGLYTEKNRGELQWPDAGVVVVLGNEVHGVDTEILPLLDHIAEIPMFGKKNSLNIAACAPVVLYEILRQWGDLDSDESQI